MTPKFSSIFGCCLAVSVIIRLSSFRVAVVQVFILAQFIFKLTIPRITKVN